MKHAKFPKNEHFLPLDTYTHVYVRIQGQEVFAFQNIWPALFSCYLRYGIHLFGSLPTILRQILSKLPNFL